MTQVAYHFDITDVNATAVQLLTPFLGSASGLRRNTNFAVVQEVYFRIFLVAAVFGVGFFRGPWHSWAFSGTSGGFLPRPQGLQEGPEDAQVGWRGFFQVAGNPRGRE